MSLLGGVTKLDLNQHMYVLQQILAAYVICYSSATEWVFLSTNPSCYKVK